MAVFKDFTNGPFIFLFSKNLFILLGALACSFSSGLFKLKVIKKHFYALNSYPT